MRLSRTGWLLVIAVVGGVAVLAVKTRPHVTNTPAFVDKGTEPAGLMPESLQSLRREETIDGQRYLIRNRIDGPIEAFCKFLQFKNVSAIPALPRDIVLGPRAELELTRIEPVNDEAHAEVEISCSAIVGDPGAPAPDDVMYALPFYPGTDYALVQGFNGAFSHHDAQSRYALDLHVAEGTPVLAARAGIVMQVESDFHAHGANMEKFGDRANYVRVLHDDGSMAVYAHLAPGTVLVKPGERVRVGAFLARSGNTGFTTGPHLHFVVQKNAGMSLQAIPYRMAGVDTTAGP